MQSIEQPEEHIKNRIRGRVDHERSHDIISETESAHDKKYNESKRKGKAKAKICNVGDTGYGAELVDLMQNQPYCPS